MADRGDSAQAGSGNAAFFAAMLARKRDRPLKRVQRWLDRRLRDLLRPIYWPIAQAMRRRGRRLLTISNPTRIGHLAAEPDWYLKARALGDLAARPATLMIRRSANPALVAVWRQQLDIAEGWRERLLRPLLGFDDLGIDLGQGIVALEGAADYARVMARWGDRPPIAALTPDIARQGEAVLARMGVPPGAWFVCFHARAGGYAPKDEAIHAHRNGDIEAFGPALDEIAARGGWGIRMGDATMAPMRPRARVIDYAVSAHKSPEMDVFLCARTRFFLGNTSGLSVLAGAFGVRSALTNMIPHAASLGIGADDIVIPKLLARGDGSLVGFPQIFAGEIANWRAAEMFAGAGLTVVENSGDEIHALVCQMLAELDGERRACPLSDAYKRLLAPGHYSFHSGSRVGRAFLEKYRALLDPGGSETE